jgi:hypothetical protein
MMIEKIKLKRATKGLLKPSHQLLLVVADEVDDLRRPPWQLVDWRWRIKGSRRWRRKVLAVEEEREHAVTAAMDPRFDEAGRRGRPT